MKIAFNPSTVAALTTPPNNKDITFDLRGHNIFARGVKFCGTDTNTWRDIKINNVSIGSNTLDLRNGNNTTLTNTNGVVTINSTWRPVVDNLTSDSTTSSLSANQGRILAGLINSKCDSEHNHDDRYLRLTGGTMQLGEGLKFHADNNYFGTNSDARIISLLDDNGVICDGGLIIDERATLNGTEYVTELLRIRDSEFKWRGSNILHSGNSYINGSTITINGSSLNVIDLKVTLSFVSSGYTDFRAVLITAETSSDSAGYTPSTVTGQTFITNALQLSPQAGNLYLKGSAAIGTTNFNHKLNVNGDIGLLNTGSIRDLAIGGGIYWNPYVESTTDDSDAASITLVRSGVAGGTTLVLSLTNDAKDTILFQTNGSARLYHNSYPILTTLNTYVSNNKGYINGTEITLINNADTVDGVHLNGIFTTFLANGNATRLVIGGVTKDLTIPYSIKSNLLYSYSLPYTNYDKVGWYCKIASVSITSQYSSKTALLCITDEYTATSSSARYGLIYIKMQQQDALGSSPNVVIRVSGSLTTSLVTGILTLSSTTSKLDIYLKEDLSYLQGYISFIQGALDIRTNSLELIQTLPSGTIINSQYGDISDQSASLLNSHKINGTSFNGTSDITTAYWGTTRTISLTGAITGSVSTNGGSNITINTTYGTGNITNLDSRYLKRTGDTMRGILSFSPNDSSDAAPKIYSTVSDVLTSLNFEVADDDNDRFVFRINYWNDTNTTNRERFTIDWNNVISKAPITAPSFIGNASTATKLLTPRTIWGQSFDGTGDVNGTIYINNSDSSNGAIRLNNNVNSNARISAINDKVIFNTGNAIRFGETSWDWNQWAGLKYTHSNKTIYLGIADNSIFNANSALSGGTLNLRAGISNIHLNSGTSIIGLPTNGSPYSSRVTLDDTSISLSAFGGIEASTGPGAIELTSGYSGIKLSCLDNNASIDSGGFKVEASKGVYLNSGNSGNVYLCLGGGNVGIGYSSPSYKLDVNGLMRASGFRHGSVNSDNYILLAGGGYKSYGGDGSAPIFLGYLDLYHGNDGTVSSSFYCLGYSVPFTYTRGGNYCRISIPDTTRLSFYINAAIASVNYSGGGMDTWVGVHRSAGAWWLHCYASGLNEVRVKGFRQANNNNDSWWGGNPLFSSNDGANKITVCIFGHVRCQ